MKINRSTKPLPQLVNRFAVKRANIVDFNQSPDKYFVVVGKFDSRRETFIAPSNYSFSKARLRKVLRMFADSSNKMIAVSDTHFNEPFAFRARAKKYANLFLNLL